ncbi:MAG TPA: hypothetical protein VGE69_00945 [Pseudomonadales bacterium]
MKMRKLVLKQYSQNGTVEIKGEVRKTPESLNYIHHIRSLCAFPKNRERGASPQETREVAPILDQLDEAEIGDSLYLTESQWADLKGRAENFPANLNQRSIVVFEDDLKAAPEVDMREEEEKTKATGETDCSVVGGAEGQL